MWAYNSVKLKSERKLILKFWSDKKVLNGVSTKLFTIYYKDMLILYEKLIKLTDYVIRN